MTFSADLLRLTTILTDFVATNSVNPTLVEGAPGETEIADLTTRHMREAGLEVTRYEPEAGRPSVVGRLAGAGGGPALMLNAHYDTVGVEGMEAPFSPSIRDGRLYGRGAYDMKGALAACIEAARLLRESEPRLAGDVLVAAVADEEYASLGTADLLERRARGELAFDAAIVTEPTSLNLCVAHRGFTWIEIAIDQCKLTTVNHLIWKYQFGVVTKRKYVTSHYHCLFLCKNDRKRKFYPYRRFDKDVKTESGGSAHYKDKEDVWEIKREYWQGAIKTPTKLPAELIEKILDYSSEKGDVVLDPFLGSGQVAVVSKMKERHYIGFEIVPAYYEFALDRLESGKYLIQKTEEQPVWDLFSQDT